MASEINRPVFVTCLSVFDSFTQAVEARELGERKDILLERRIDEIRKDFEECVSEFYRKKHVLEGASCQPAACATSLEAVIKAANIVTLEKMYDPSLLKEYNKAEKEFEKCMREPPEAWKYSACVDRCRDVPSDYVPFPSLHSARCFEECTEAVYPRH